jgi:hypothetical protein
MESNIILDGIETDYIVTDTGKVFSLKYGKTKELKFNPIKGGYLICNMFVDGKKKSVLVHRLVATAFLNNPQNKPQVNHKDNDKANNNFWNLEWATQSENVKHAYDNGFMKKTFKDMNALLNESQIWEIRQHLKDKVKQRFIADMFGVSEQIISQIKLGKTYIGVGYDLPKEMYIEKSETFN